MKGQDRTALMLSIARLLSLKGTCLRAQVGAVIARNGRIISTGYNGSPPGEPHCTDLGIGCLLEEGHCRRTIHAEANAIAFAAKYGISTEGATLYISGYKEVCPLCTKLAKSAGIKEFIVDGQNNRTHVGRIPEEWSLGEHDNGGDQGPS